jgi:NADH/NAD ratio-sensing transcriptional regulator Rex
LSEATSPKPRKRSKRLKTGLLKELQAAGSEGITVKELAAKLKVKPGNVFSWFYTTGKKIKGIKKVGEAKYSLRPE